MHRPLLGPILLTAIVSTIVAIYWTTFHGLAIQGDRSDAAWRPAFVLATFVWMLWGMRERLSSLPVKVFRPGLLLLLTSGFAWLVGELVFVRVLSNFAVVMMIPAAVLAVLGWQWLRELVFPLGYLFFIVPIGGPLIPMLVDWTATVAFAGLNFSGLTVYREGAYFELASGRWSVADACSGIEYLTTCAMLGSLFAWQMYRRQHKRLAFFMAAIVLGVTGNWLRVYLTIAIAHLTDNLWLRESHGSFGWALFASLMTILTLVGWRFRDGDDHAQSVVGEAGCPSPVYAVGLVSALAIGFLIVWPLLVNQLKVSATWVNTETVTAKPQNGWIIAADRASTWLPDLQNPRSIRVQSFEKNGKRVDVIIAMFQDQSWGSQLVTSGNQIANSENQNWSLANRGKTIARYQDREIKVDSSLVIGRGIKATVWRWYWLRGKITASDLEAKWLQLVLRLNSKDDRGAWVAICADASVAPQMANDLLATFLREMGDSLQNALSMADAH